MLTYQVTEEQEKIYHDDNILFYKQSEFTYYRNIFDEYYYAEFVKRWK